MIITVRNGLYQQFFLDNNFSRIATLRRKKLFGPKKVVLGPDNSVKYETDIENLTGKPAGENRCYTIKQGGALVATALPVYAADADYYSVFKPPRPQGLFVEMQNGEHWLVKRDKKNTLEIQSPVGAGRLSNFFSVCLQVYEIPNDGNVFLWVGLYALASYMMHEDVLLAV